MAHELARDKSGTASMLSVRQTPWHREGVVLPFAPSYEDAIRIARLDYTVEKRQCHLIIPPGVPNGAEKKVETGAYVTYRTDNDAQLGVVEGRYTVVQNTDVFRILVPLIESGIATVETAGVLREGCDAWLLVRLALDQLPLVVQKTFGEEDTIKPYILIANNHSGRRGILAALTAVRVVCANTLGAAEGAGVSDQIVIRHTTSAEAQLIDAAYALWGNISAKYTRIAEAYEVLRSTYLTPQQFQTLVIDTVAPDPRNAPKWTAEAKMAGFVLDRYIERKEALIDLWTNGAGHSGEPTAWFAYNSAVEAIDHRSDLFPTRSGVFRTAALLDGNLRKKKADVFTNLMEFANQPAAPAA